MSPIVVLDAEGTLVLRIPGGSAFSDPRLDALVGKTIEGEGTVHAGVFLLERWREIA